MTDKKILALFPGQGSQKVGMGKDLYEAEPLARDIFDRADEALGFSLTQICFDGPPEKLTATENAQPAILTVSVICYELFKQASGGRITPVAAAGHSLGEYSALVAAGAIKFEDAVLQVHKRGRYMQEAVPAGEGAMIAILGKEVGEIEEAISRVSEGVVQIANINAPGQIVAAGHKGGVAALKEIMAGSKIMDLPVSAPFHCSLMKPAEDRLRADLAELSIDSAQFPVIANFCAAPVRSADEIRTNLGSQVCGRVRWVESMETAARDFQPDLAVEFGNGNVLSGLLKRINAAMPRANADSAASIQKLAAEI